MKIVFWGNGNRAVPCLKALLSVPHDVTGALLHPKEESHWHDSIAQAARNAGIETIATKNPNDEQTERWLRAKGADLFVLAGFGKILKREIFSIPKIVSLNLHAGKLPQYRGSSPMNWALINGEKSFSLSVIKLTEEIDGGDVFAEESFDVPPHYTINDLHEIANQNFPKLLLDAIRRVSDKTYEPRKQSEQGRAYYPLRFPDDGLVVWDMLSAEQIHNRIRALTEPYPCAFTFVNGRKVKLRKSSPAEYNYFGEPGRIYKKTRQGMLVCASDKCLWITDAVFEDGDPFAGSIRTYDKFLTLKDALVASQGHLFR